MFDVGIRNKRNQESNKADSENIYQQLDRYANIAGQLMIDLFSFSVQLRTWLRKNEFRGFARVENKYLKINLHKFIYLNRTSTILIWHKFL